MDIKKTLKNIGNKIKDFIDKAYRNYQYNSKLYEIKMEILSKFSMKDLRRICKIKGISTKKVVEMDFDPLVFSWKEKTIEIKEKYELAERIASKLSLKEIISFAKRYGISYQRELEELKEFEEELFEKKEENMMIKEFEEKKERNYEVKSVEEGGKNISEKIEDFEKILRILREDFKPEVVRSEEDFEKQVYQFLSGRLGKERVERQVNIKGSRIDLLIDGKYGIEIKIADSVQKLYELIGQTMNYKEILGNVIAVILDTGVVKNIENFIEKLEKQGIKVVRLFGIVKKSEKKGRIIINIRR
jgi:N6-adenosine-specific RNA methylase IME4